MSIKELLKHITPFTLLLFPERVEKWSVLFWKIIYFFIKRGEKKIVAHDIQAGVNEFSKSLKKEIINFEPIGIHIQWITKKVMPAEFFREDKLIIRMRQHTDQDKNFVNASMIFIVEVFFRKSKKYLSPTQKESFDLFVARKLFKKEKPQVVNQFFENYFSQKAPLILSHRIMKLMELGEKYEIIDKAGKLFPKLPLWIHLVTFLGIKADQFFEDYYSRKPLSINKVMELVERYEIIDKVGLFLPILVNELNLLGEKVFYKPRKEKIITEVAAFISFLQRYAEKEEGEETVPENFEGAYCRCVIIIIARQLKRKISDLDPFINYIKKLVDRKFESIYLIGSSSKENRSFIDQISEEIQRKFRLQKYRCKEVKTKVTIKGERKEVKNYLILHRSTETVRYYDKEYQKKFIESKKSSNL